jgi:ABC-type Mn2+/Zn2+ transport system permease subunit
LQEIDLMPDALSRLVLAGLVTGVVDGLFSSVLSVVFYHSTVRHLFQGVAATLLGNKAFDGGAQTAVIGVLMHFGVAFGWIQLIGHIPFVGIPIVACASYGGWR